MKSKRYVALIALLATVISLSACEKGHEGFSGRFADGFGDPGGGPPAGGPPPGGGSWVEPRLAYQPDAGTRLFDLRISGVGLMVVFVMDGDPLGTNPDQEEQIFSYDIGTGQLVQLTFEPMGSPTTFANFDITDNGDNVVFVTTDDITGNNPTNSSNIFMASTDGASVTQVTDNTLGFLADPQIAANPAGGGNVIVFYSESDLVGNNAVGNRELFKIDSDGSNLTQLTTNNAFPEEIVLSDDGTRIAYHSPLDPFGANPDNSREIFVIDIDGNGHAQLTDSTADALDPDISDDGSLIAFTSRGDLIPGGNGDGSYEVFVANADGTGILQITSSADDSGTYTSGAPGALEIAGFGNFVVFGSDADHTGENPSQEHTIFWASTDGTTIGQPLKEGYVPPTVDSRAADNPHIINDGEGILFDSAVNYSFDSSGTTDKIFTTVRN
jgi:hypothetical protein